MWVLDEVVWLRWLELAVFGGVTAWLFFRVRRLHRGRKVALRRIHGA